MSLIAADIMTTSVKTVPPEASVAEVARLLCDNAISAVPVCDDQGHVLGMLSEGDLLVPVGKERAMKRTWWLNLLAEGTDLAPSFLECISVENQRAVNLMVGPASPQRRIPACRNWPIYSSAITSSDCRSCATAKSSGLSAERIWCVRWQGRPMRLPKRSEPRSGSCHVIIVPTALRSGGCAAWPGH
jgi:hypothetical protein